MKVCVHPARGSQTVGTPSGRWAFKNSPASSCCSPSRSLERVPPNARSDGERFLVCLLFPQSAPHHTLHSTFSSRPQTKAGHVHVYSSHWSRQTLPSGSIDCSAPCSDFRHCTADKRREKAIYTGLKSGINEADILEGHSASDSDIIKPNVGSKMLMFTCK